MLRFTAPLLLVTLLMSPVGASAQTSPPAKAPSQKVSLQVTFVTVNTDDLDALGINFDAHSLPASPETYLRCADGNIVPQLYQTLTRTTARTGSRTFALLPLKVSDDVPAVFAVNAHIPVSTPANAVNQQYSSFPQLTDTLQIHGKITLLPQIVLGTLVRLDMLSPLGSNQRMPLYCIPSGQQIVINAAVVKAQPIAGRVQLEGGSGRNKVSHTTEILIFITPTILSAGANGGTISVKP